MCDKIHTQFEMPGLQAGDVLIDGMRALGFETLLSDDIQAPIIITFHMPSDPSFEFTEFYNRLTDLGFVIYPGKLTVAESFRIGCIGQLYEPDMRNALAAIKYTLETMAVEEPEDSRAQQQADPAIRAAARASDGDTRQGCASLLPSASGASTSAPPRTVNRRAAKSHPRNAQP